VSAAVTEMLTMLCRTWLRHVWC